MLHRAACAIQPWRQRRVDRQFDSARAVSADLRRCDACLSRLWLLASSARPSDGLRGRRGLLPAIARRGGYHRARCRDAPCCSGGRFRFHCPLRSHLTTGDDLMAKTPLNAATSAILLLSAAAFAAEKTVTLSVENMTCSACPHIVKGAPRFGVRDVVISFEDKTATSHTMTPRRRSPRLSALPPTQAIPLRRRAKARHARGDTDFDDHLPFLRASQNRNDAHGRLPIFLRMPQLQSVDETQER